MINIAYIAAGAGDMYCGACTRDINLAKGLIHKGHQIQLIPLYTPLRAENPPQTTKVFYGGINAYLQQAFSLFRHTPLALDRFWDNPKLLAVASKFAIKTNPSKLGTMTVSVLKGKNGHQKKELYKLIEFLKKQPVEIINITNSMLSGIAPELKNHLKVPIVCFLQGEDSFVEALGPPYSSQACKLISQNAEFIDAFIVPTTNYKDYISNLFGIDREKIAIIRPGIDTNEYSLNSHLATKPFTIGYLSRIAPEKGLDTLITAYDIVAKENKNIALKIAGKIIDHKFYQKMCKKISKDHFLGEVDFTQKLDFLDDCSVFCVPSKIFETRGMVVLEAMARGIPAIMPNEGIFPEIKSLCKAGFLFAKDNAQELANVIAKIIKQPEQLENARNKGREGITTYYSITQMVEETLQLYSKLLDGKDYA